MMVDNTMIEIGIGGSENGLFIRTTGMGKQVTIISMRGGSETVLDATQILKDIGWAPVLITREMRPATRDEKIVNPGVYEVQVMPDLLESLITITNQLERVGDTRLHKDGQFIKDARAVIDAALGHNAPP